MNSEGFGCHEESDLAAAWAKAYLQIRSVPHREIAPFAMSIHCPDGIVPPDSLKHPMVRALDACFENDGPDYRTVELVAFTLFPQRLWKLHIGNRAEFYREAMRNLRTFATWEPT